MPNHHLSTIVITLNEAATIKGCLESVMDISDEIIVLDSHSTDNTESICRQFPKVRFVKTDWLGYSQTKNKGVSLAKYDAILSIDADERLDDDAKNQIQHLKQSGIKGAYSFNRKNFYGNTWIKHCGWYPDVKTRLYLKGTCEWKGDFVHETLECRNDTQIHHLPGDIEHYTIRDSAHHKETIHKYALLAAQRDKTNQKSQNALKALISTVSHFIKIYVVKLGVLDGGKGFSIAVNSAKSKWLRYVYFKGLK